jgi:hypothetical protein
MPIARLDLAKKNRKPKIAAAAMIGAGAPFFVVASAKTIEPIGVPAGCIASFSVMA